MSDNVNHPKHYTGFSNGAEVIDITENLSFNLGNVVKYAARAGRKTDDPIEDLRKAQFYLDREIKRLSASDYEITTWTLSTLNALKDAWGQPEYTKTKYRQWDTIDEVPLYVTVRDGDGDLWRYNPDNLDLELRGNYDGAEWSVWEFNDDEHPNGWGPFQEVKDNE